jgi:hypothetical protein
MGTEPLFDPSECQEGKLVKQAEVVLNDCQFVIEIVVQFVDSVP